MATPEQKIYTLHSPAVAVVWRRWEVRIRGVPAVEDVIILMILEDAADKRRVPLDAPFSRGLDVGKVVGVVCVEPT